AEGNELVEDWQVLGFLNLDNNELYLGGRSLSGNTQDNGLCTESEGFDYLIGMNDEKLDIQNGEVYVPVCYRSMYDLKSGDIMKIGDEELKIAGFIRDSQMNSMMASSKRFLVSNYDYERLKPKGSEEYLIEFSLIENADTDLFAADYNKAGLPSNGPAITKSLILLMNALSDGIMIFVIFLAGIAMTLVSLLCIGFITSLGVEHDRSEAGMLKAIGIGRKEIRHIYISKYVLFSAVGGGTGLIIAMFLSTYLGKSLKELYGSSGNAVLVLFVSVAACVMTELIILGYIRGILKKNEKMTVREAMGKSADAGKKSNAGRVIIIGLVTAVCVMLALIPENLHTTLSSPDFVTYMGIGRADIRMDVRQRADIDAATEELLGLLEKDKSVDKYVVLKTISCPALTIEGETINLLLEIGNHSVFPVSYTDGREPVNDGEIALSVLQAKDLGLGIGEKIILGAKGGQLEATVCGLYSDITNGGKTAKMSMLTKLPGEYGSMWSILYVTLKEASLKDEWISAYKSSGAEVVDIKAYVNATYGPTIESVGRVRSISIIMALVIVFVVVNLFVRLIVEKNRKRISLSKALGFRSTGIRKEYMIRSCIPVVAGVLTGSVMAFLFGEGICGTLLQSLGAGGFRFVIRPVNIAVILILLLITGYFAIASGTKEIKNIKAFECCRGEE
ncbi:MAG: ABC transporter permease, partial [Eubacteriales bacterium]|nr:ABC transporter permease [Eubacteriales bacterium]